MCYNCLHDYYSNTKYFNYEVTKYPVVKLGNDIDLCDGSSVKIGSGHWDVNYDILWNTGSKSDSIVVNSHGGYMQTITTKLAGCSMSDTIYVQYHPMPNSAIWCSS